MRPLPLAVVVLAAAAIAVAPPARAGAQVTLGGGAITISLPGARVSVAIEDPLLTGLNDPAAPTLYAPVSFLVGSESLQQYPGGLWGAT